MSDASTVSPIFQLVGTAITVLGGIAVAWIAKGGKGKAKATAIDQPLAGVHADVILLIESVSGLKVLLSDFWQWQRDRETVARERHEWLKENIRENQPR